MPPIPRARRALAFALAALVAVQVPLPGVGAAPTPLAVTTVPLNLWLHNDYTMSMAGNAQEGPPADSLMTLRTWAMTDGLQKDLCIDGVDIGSGRLGIQVELQIVYGKIGAGTLDLAMSLKDDATVIANGTFPLTGTPGGQGDIWNLNFTAARTSCNVLRGHRLALDVVVARTGAGSSTAIVGNIRNAHVAFIASDPLLPTAHTENANGAATTFYPNDIDGSRQVILNGSLGNAFTDVFVSVVRVTIRDGALNAIENATGIVTSGNWTYTWNYPRLPSGSYSAAIQVEDTQAHTYNVTTSFTFVAFGLRINTADALNGQASRYTTTGVCAVYDLTVTNVGGQPATVSLNTETTVPALWRATFAPNSLSLEPDASDVSRFEVCPDPLVGPGNSTQITVVAIATNDPAPIDARAQLATTTVVQREIFLVIAPPATTANVKLGALANYDFTITNNGGLATDVMLNATVGANGWGRTLAPLPPLVEEAGGWRLPGLAAGGTAALTLTVTAPTSATADTTFACTVTARSVENASAVATFLGTTHLVLGIELAQTSLPVSPEAAPAGFVDFQFEATNTDPLADHTVSPGDISVVEQGIPQFIEGVEGGSITIAPPLGCCAAATSQVLSVTLQLPTHARAGRYTFTLWVQYDGDPNKVAFLNFSLSVTQVTDYYLRLAEPTSQVVLHGTASTHIAAFIVSESNYDLSVDLSPAVLKDGDPDSTWVVRLLGPADAEMSLRLLLRAYAEVPVNLSVSASPSAWNGEHRDLAFTISISLSGAHPVAFAPPIDLVVELDGATVFARMWQQSQFIVFLFAILAIGAAAMARTALRGRMPPRPPPPPPPKKPASTTKPAPAPTSAAGPPKA